MKLILPYPISANLYWRTVVVKSQGALGPDGPQPYASTYVSEEAKRYKRDVRIAAYEQGVRAPIAGRVSVGIQLYPHRPLDWQKRVRADPMNWDDDVRCLDLDNAFKVLNDALRGVAFKDDAWIRRIEAERMEPDTEGARVVVTIQPIVRKSPQASLLEAATA